MDTPAAETASEEYEHTNGLYLLIPGCAGV